MHQTSLKHHAPLHKLTIAAAGTVILILLGWIIANPNEICCDCAIGIEWGRELFHGARPYVDASELDPPLLGYLNLLPALLQTITQAPLVLTFSLTAWFFCLLSKLAVWQIGNESSKPLRIQRWLASIILVAAIFDLMMVNTQGILMFGQREHMLVVFFLPFFILRYTRWNGGSKLDKRWAFLYGFEASLLVCLKHYFALLPASLELYWLCKNKQGRDLLQPEIYGAITFAVVYALHFLLFPDLREHFLYTWVPILMQGYAYSSFTLEQMFWITVYVKGYFELLLSASCFAFIRGNCAKLVIPSVIYGWAAYAIYLWQAKSWSYQAIPVIFAVFLALTLGFTNLCWRFTKQKHREFIAIAGASLSALLLFGVLHLEFINWELEYQDKPDPAIVKLIETKSRNGDPILFLSTSPGNAYPLIVQLNRKSGCRYPYEYGIDFFTYMREHNTGVGRSPLKLTEDIYIQEIADDIKARQPKLILIRENAQIRPRTEVPVYQYVIARPELRKAFEAYHTLPAVGGMHIFELNTKQ